MRPVRASPTPDTANTHVHQLEEHVSWVKSRWIPLIRSQSTMNRYLDQDLIDILIDTQSTSQSIVGQPTSCQLSLVRDVDEALV